MNSEVESCLNVIDASLMLDFLLSFAGGCFYWFIFWLNAFSAEILYIKLSNWTFDYFSTNFYKLCYFWFLTPDTIKSQINPFKSPSLIQENFLFLNRCSKKLSIMRWDSFSFPSSENKVYVKEKRQLTLMFWITTLTWQHSKDIEKIFVNKLNDMYWINWVSMVEKIVWIILRYVSESPDFVLFWINKIMSIICVRRSDITCSGLWWLIVSDRSLWIFFFEAIEVFYYSFVD